ncbi:MAG: peptidase MA family metallohydrolase [Deltaproteobacteria bacterium]|nr:peptidase MA family metallohydrolase [Deltaproteobacteria bacterium]
MLTRYVLIFFYCLLYASPVSCRLTCEVDENPNLANGVCRKACQHLSGIEAFFEVPRGSTSGLIKIVSNPQYFNNYRAPVWSNAFFVNGTILIPYSTFRSSSFEKALRHELSHLVIYKNFGPNVPEWIDEGFALFLEGQPRTNLIAYLNLWRSAKQRVSLQNISAGISALPKKEAVQAYAISYFAIDFILQRGYKKQLLNFLNNKRRGHLPVTIEQIERALLKDDMN